MHKHYKKNQITRLRRALLIAIVVIAGLHYAFVVTDLLDLADGSGRFTWLVDLDGERNLPTIYSTLLSIGIGVVAAGWMFSQTYLIRRLFWFGVSVVFLYWAFDELLVLHERLAEPIRDLLSIEDGSPFYHAWVLVAFGAIAVVGLIALALMLTRRHQIDHTMRRLTAAIFLYMCGIVLFEITGTRAYSNQALYRLVFVPAEELFEISMASLILLRVVSYVPRGVPKKV